MKPSAKNNLVTQALSLDGNTDNLSEFYAQWAQAYDADLAEEGYVAPEILADLLADFCTVDCPTILDAGCGTGLMGCSLARRGFNQLDGFDLSEEMAAVARARGCYRKVVSGIDMNQPIRDLGGEFDMLACCGVFTLGHVPPESLTNILALIRVGGMMGLSTRTSYLQASGFDDLLRNLASSRLLEIKAELHEMPYTSEETASFWLLERTSEDVVEPVTIVSRAT